MSNAKAGAVVVLATVVFCSAANAQRTQAERERQAAQDRATLRQFPEVGRAARDVSPIIDRAARQEAERASRAATSNRSTVTSRDRPANHRLSSPAHDRGAIDVTTPNMQRDAGRISREAGRNYTVIHEQPGRTRDTHTIYQNGNRVNQTSQPRRATGEHIHVQPEFNRRLHNATRTPTPRTEGGVGPHRSASAR